MGRNINIKIDLVPSREMYYTKRMIPFSSATLSIFRNCFIFVIVGGMHFGDVTAIAAASGGGLASNEVNLSIPMHNTDLTSYASLLDFLLSCYGIPVVWVFYLFSCSCCTLEAWEICSSMYMSRSIPTLTIPLGHPRYLQTKYSQPQGI